MCKMLSTRKSCQRPRSWGFYWTLVTQTPSTYHPPKFQTPRRKACAQHKPYFLHKQSKYSEPFLLGNNRLKIHVPRCWPRAILASRPTSSRHRPAMLTLFCTIILPISLGEHLILCIADNSTEKCGGFLINLTMCNFSLWVHFRAVLFMGHLTISIITHDKPFVSC